MARFSARSSLTHPPPPRSRPARRHKKRPSSNKRPPSAFARYAHIRKAELSSRATPSTRSPLCFVYVGNLRSDVCNDDLESLFTLCGKVIKIDIRCCSGNAVPGSYADTVYATVLFASVEGATRALEMNGDPLLEKKMVVTPSFLGLPEANRSIGRKKVAVLGVNLTKINDRIQHVVDRFRTGGTQVFTMEEDY